MSGGRVNCALYAVGNVGDALCPLHARYLVADIFQGNALNLVCSTRYELGAPCPKFSGLQEVQQRWQGHTNLAKREEYCRDLSVGRN